LAICCRRGDQRGERRGGEIGEYLATSKRIAKVAFTGSTEVGQQIMQYATQNIIPVTLELGGNPRTSSLPM
jgi:acyl-CoA reductase-like NAD-dependent aldehyde dehydrogenase